MRAGEPQADERGEHRDRHAERRHAVAAAGETRRAQELEPDDEQDRREQVGRVKQERQGRAGIHPFFPVGFLALNISSMRSVTTKPPNRFMAPSTTATKPSAVSSGVFAVASTRTPPSITMPWIPSVPAPTCPS